MTLYVSRWINGDSDELGRQDSSQASTRTEESHTRTPVLEAERLTAQYNGCSEPALCDVDLALHPGELVAVLGPNGAGKTSLVRAITGLLPPRRGEVRLFGRPIQRLGRRTIAKHIAVVSQRCSVDLNFTVEQVVAMGRAPHQGSMLFSSKEDKGFVSEALETTKLTSLARRAVSTLSAGEQKRVAIARAFAQRPDILILDEAGSNLDIGNRTELMAIVRRQIRYRKLACLSIVHDMTETAQVADRVVILREGRILAAGSVGDVMTRGLLREVFGVDLDVIRSGSSMCFVPLLRV